MSNDIYTKLSTSNKISSFLLSEIVQLSNDISVISVDVKSLSSEHDASINYLDLRIDEVSAELKLISAYVVKDNSAVSELDLTLTLNDEDLYLVSQPSPDTETGYISKHVLFRDIKGAIISDAYLSLDIDYIGEEIETLSNKMSKINLYESVEISCRSDPPGAYIMSSIVLHYGNLVSCSGYLFKDALADNFHTYGPEPYVSGYYAPISSDYIIGLTMKLTPIEEVTTGTPRHKYVRNRIDLKDEYAKTLTDITDNYRESSESLQHDDLALYKIKTNKLGQVIDATKLTVDVENEFDKKNLEITQINNRIDSLSTIVNTNQTNVTNQLNTKLNKITTTELTTVLSPDNFLLKNSSGQFKEISYENLYEQLKTQFLTLLSYLTRSFTGNEITTYACNKIKNLKFDSMFNDPIILANRTSTTLWDKDFLKTSFTLQQYVDTIKLVRTSVNSSVPTALLDAYEKVFHNLKDIINSAINKLSYLRVSIPMTHKSLVSLTFNSDISTIRRNIALNVYLTKNNGLRISTTNASIPYSHCECIGSYKYIGYNKKNSLCPLVDFNTLYANDCTCSPRYSHMNNPYALAPNKFIIDAEYIMHIVVAGQLADLFTDGSSDPFSSSLSTVSDAKVNLMYGPSTITDRSSSTLTTSAYSKVGCISVDDLLNLLRIKVTPLWDCFE